MNTRTIVPTVLFVACSLAGAQVPRPSAVCRVSDVLRPAVKGGVRAQSDSFQFPVRINVHPDRGWLHGEKDDFAAAGDEFDIGIDPGTLRLAPVSLSEEMHRDFATGVQGIAAGGAFRANWESSSSHNGAGCVRIDTVRTGAGRISLSNDVYGAVDYPEFEMWYKADYAFEGFTVYATVKQGMVTWDVALMDVRVDRLEDCGSPYNGQWQRLRLDVAGLLANAHYPDATVAGIYISNTVAATGAHMWIDDERIFGASYPDYADYISPPHRLDSPKDFDTLYWASTRVFHSPYTLVFAGRPLGELKFQIRSGTTRSEMENAQWLGPTSGDDWYESGAATVGKQLINQAHNGDTWVQVRARLVSSADHRHTPVLEDFCVTWGAVNTWDTLMLLTQSVDADWTDADGVTQHETYTMPQGYVDDVKAQFNFFAAYVDRYFSFGMKLHTQVEVITTPVTGAMLSGSGSGGYVIDPYQALPLYQQWVGDGKWDSIMFHFRWEKIPFPAWALAWGGTWLPGGATMIQVLYIGPGYDHQEVDLHEWIHTLAWTSTDRTDGNIPHSHLDSDPHWDPANMNGMDYYQHCIEWHGTRDVYDTLDAIAPINSPYQRTWLTCGYFPFDTMADDGLFTDYIGEALVLPFYGSKSAGKQWTQIASGADYVDMSRKYGATAGRAAYADVYVNVPEDRNVRLWTGTADGFRAWVNNDLVRSRHQHRGADPRYDSTGLWLGQGWNNLMLKVENFDGDGWGFYGRLTDYLGGPLPGVTVTTWPGVYSGVQNVSGRVSVAPYADPTKARLRFEVTDPSTGEVVCGRWVYPAADGSYKLTPVPRGLWDLRVSGTHWLRAVGSLNVHTSDLTGVDVSLVNGDVDGDNVVGLTDLAWVLADFTKVKTQDSDLDGDGQVGLTDLGIVLTSFGQAGG
jgi:hypothetical protein